MRRTATNGAWERFTLHGATNRHLVALHVTRDNEESEEGGQKEAYPQLRMILSGYVFPTSPLY